ncbi:methyl-accepting chemotaxis protein [Alkaliphilus crotonatoxidans]
MKKNKVKSSNRVRNQLIIVMILIIVLPVSLLGFLSYRRAYSILEEKLKLTTEQTANQAADSLNEYFLGIERQVKALAENSLVIKLAREGQLGGDEASQNQYFDLAMELLANANHPNESVLNTYVGTESKGMYLYPRSEVPAGYDPTDRPWYSEALKNPDRVAWTDPYIDTNSGQYTITASKIIQDNGSTLGVVAFDVDIEGLAEKIGNVHLGNEGYLVLASQQGIVISHPDVERIGTNDITGQSFWETVVSHEADFIRYEFDGGHKFMSFTTIPSTGWKLMGAMEAHELLTSTSDLLNYILIGVIIASILGVGIAIIISRRISGPLNQLKGAFGRASTGDLSVFSQINTNDEFGELSASFNTMMENIRALIEDVQNSSRTVVETATALAGITEQTSAATNEVALTVEEIAKSAGEQARDTETGAVKVNELAGKIEEVLLSTQSVKDVAEETNELSSQGLRTLEELVEKTIQTRDSAIEVSKIINSLHESADAISIITQTITQISEQTNLLALNAAIEAARAGEAGKGFAVVADEIRKLAEQSGNATKEIYLLIEGIQNQANNAVVSMDTAQNIVMEQDKAVTMTQEIFNQISGAITAVKQKVNEVEQSSDEMALKKDEIVGVIENVSATAEETSAATQQVSAATEEQLASIEEVASHARELQELADILKNAIEKFTVRA